MNEMATISRETTEPVFAGSPQAAPMVDIGLERLNAGDVGNARAMFAGALAIDADCFDAHNNISAALAREGHIEAALASARRALAIRPDNAAALSNAGINCWRLGRYAEALSLLTDALARNPDGPGVHHNIGLVYYSMNRPRLAVEHLDKAISLKPDNVHARSDLALAVLKDGRLHDGLVEHEVRWEGLLAKSAVWECGLPRWEGEDVVGKTILVHHEQGFGDTIQFVRFVRDLFDRHARVILAVPAPLIRLIDRGWIYKVINIDKPGDIVAAALEADFHCPMLSVARLTGAEFDTLPNLGPYLRVPPSPGARRAIKTPGVKLAIGVAWAASPGHHNSRVRSVPIERMLRLAEIKGVRLYSFQVGPYRDDLARTGADQIVTDLAPSITDFADTARLMSEMDLVISVDSAPAHVAGAIGVPVWMFNPYVPCWRWCRGAEPWYPTMRLWNQRRPNDDWRDVVDAMAIEIEGMVR